MIHIFTNLHLDVIAGVFAGSGVGYMLGRLRGRGGRR